MATTNKPRTKNLQAKQFISKQRRQHKAKQETKAAHLDIISVNEFLEEIVDPKNLEGRWVVRNPNKDWPQWIIKGLRGFTSDRQMVWSIPHNANAGSNMGYDSKVEIDMENTCLNVTITMPYDKMIQNGVYEFTVPWKDIEAFECRGVGKTGNPKVLRIKHIMDYQSIEEAIAWVHNLSRVPYPNMRRYNWDAIRTVKEI